MFVVMVLHLNDRYVANSAFDTDEAADVVEEARLLWERFVANDQGASVTVSEGVGADDVRRIAGPCAVPDLAAAMVGVRGLYSP